MSYRWNSNSYSNVHPNCYHHHHVVVRQTETLVSDGDDSRCIHMNSHPPKRMMDSQFSGGYGYTVLEPPQVKNPDLMMLVANDMEYNNNWVQPQYPSNWQDHRVTSSLERRSRPSFEVGYGASRVSSGEEMVDAEADEFLRFKHRKFEQDGRKGSVRAG